MRRLPIMLAVAGLIACTIAAPASAHEYNAAGNPYCGHQVGGYYVSPFSGTAWVDLTLDHFTLQGVHHHVVLHQRLATVGWVDSYVSLRVCEPGESS